MDDAIGNAQLVPRAIAVWRLSPCLLLHPSTSWSSKIHALSSREDCQTSKMFLNEMSVKWFLTCVFLVTLAFTTCSCIWWPQGCVAFHCPYECPLLWPHGFCCLSFLFLLRDYSMALNHVFKLSLMWCAVSAPELVGEGGNQPHLVSTSPLLSPRPLLWIVFQTLGLVYK